MSKKQQPSAGAPHGRRGRRERRTRLRAWFMVACGIIIVTVAIVLLMQQPRSEVASVTVHGVEYTTNVPVEAFEERTYVRLPVNAVIEEVHLVVAHPEDNERIEAFLEGLNVFIPGEYEVPLSTGTLHVIVDGLAGSTSE